MKRGIQTGAADLKPFWTFLILSFFFLQSELLHAAGGTGSRPGELDLYTHMALEAAALSKIYTVMPARAEGADAAKKKKKKKRPEQRCI